ncbi:site-specific integrase [Amycolatopsis carbonis]|uniref:Site-specific integrase n=1 Tax=Amycolatopsis carbonis TaxID=715471 RepID=A0A9Y2MVD9_9PSEU|nr:site-specific integrase [Amycolatopsis sp. 2-15]WIX76794.1 site-specific integrase [Amycolatopsis sp. 2-15]
MSASTAGTINPITRKPHLGNGYQPRTIRHSNAVIRSFYEFHREDGRRGPLLNPMPLDAHAWRGYDGAFEGRPRTEGRIRFNPQIPQRLPRAMPDEQWNTVFGMLRSHRDRAIVAMGVSSAARPAELLGMTGPDVDWGEQQIRVVRKGTRAEQWLPVSAEALVWLRLYLAELDELAPTVPLWQTLRRRDRGCGLTRQPLSYDSLRAVFRRLNAALGTNWTLHDLRHTAAIRMSRDPRLSMRDVQVILGHAHLSTTAEVYLVEDQAEVLLRAAEHLAALAAAPAPQPRPTAPYAAADLQVLFGGELR